MMIIAGRSIALLVAPFVIALIVCVLWGIIFVHRMINRLSAPVHRAEIVHNFSFMKVVCKRGLMVGVLLCLWLALARMQYEGENKTPQYEQGRDVVVLLDVSRSMLAQDVQPSRLVCAKNKIKKLLDQLASERVALIIFSGGALVQCPLTKDFDAFELFLDAIDAESLSSGTTDLASGLQSAVNLFEQDPARQSKLIVLVTDGEDFSKDLSVVREKIEQQHICICTLSVGTAEGAPIPLYDPDGVLQGHMRDDAGKVVMSRVNEHVLQALANDFAGLYIRADAASDRDIVSICRWVQKFEKERFSTADCAVHEETFMYYTGAGLAMLFMSRLL